MELLTRSIKSTIVTQSQNRTKDSVMSATTTQRNPLFGVEVKGDVGKKSLVRLVSLVFDGSIQNFTYRTWSTGMVGIKHLVQPFHVDIDEGWRIPEDGVAFYIDPLCEQVLRQLAGEGADTTRVRWRAETRWVADELLLEVQLEPS